MVDARDVVEVVGSAAAGAGAGAMAYRAWRNVSERTIMDGKPTTLQRVEAARLSADANTFQFKSGGDGAGVTDRLSGVSRWNPAAAGKVMVYEYADGRQVIADGHQRLGLAKRLMSEGHEPIKMDAIVLRQRDGWQPRDVRAYAAIKNMHESSGHSLDMARVMRERPDLVTGSLPISDAKIREARSLARLSEPAFNMVASGTVKPDVAAAVGDAVKDSSRHLDYLNEMTKAKVASGQHARLYVSQAMAAPVLTETTGSLFGDETTTRSLLKERAQVLDKALTALKQDKRIFGLLEREAGTIEAAGNRLSHAANVERATGAGRLAEMVEKLSTTRGPISEMLDRAAAAIAKGEAPAKAARAFVKDVGDTMKRGGISALTGNTPSRMQAMADDGTGAPKPEPRGMDGLTRSERAGRKATVTAAPSSAPAGASMMERFQSAYEATLAERVRANPERYAYGVDRVPEFARKMTEALAAGRGDHQSPTVQAVAKSLGIKPTLGEIQAALSGQPAPVKAKVEGLSAQQMAAVKRAITSGASVNKDALARATNAQLVALDDVALAARRGQTGGGGDWAKINGIEAWRAQIKDFARQTSQVAVDASLAQQTPASTSVRAAAQQLADAAANYRATPSGDLVAVRAAAQRLQAAHDALTALRNQVPAPTSMTDPRNAIYGGVGQLSNLLDRDGASLSDPRVQALITDLEKRGPAGWSDAARAASADQRGVARPGEAKPERQYHLAAVNDKTGRTEPLSVSPMTHDQAVTMKSKFSPSKDVRLLIVEADSPQAARLGLAPTKSPGQLAYEQDVAAKPTYHDGGKRKTWAQLGEAEKGTWEKNPTPRFQHKQPESYWSTKAPPTPTVADLPPGAFKGTDKEFSSLSPGMRREIERAAERRNPQPASSFDSREAPAAKPAQTQSTSDWLAEREQRIRDSKAAGNKHLDNLPRDVEGMRGVAFHNVHDPKERGFVRTVANTGEVVVQWADEYSANKNLAPDPVKDGKRMVRQSWLAPTDLKDYAVSPKGQTSFIPPPTTKEKLTAAAASKGKPAIPQQPMDQGLFGSGMKQLDLVEMAKGKPEKVQIVLARTEMTGLRDTGELHRPDGVNYRPKLESVPEAKAAMWLNSGTAADVEKAKAYAAKEGFQVYTYPAGEKDPLGKAKAEAMQAVGKNPGWQDAAREASAKERGVALPGQAKVPDLKALSGAQINAILHDGGLPHSGTRAQKEARIAKHLSDEIGRKLIDHYASQPAEASSVAKKAKALRGAPPPPPKEAAWSSATKKALGDNEYLRRAVAAAKQPDLAAAAQSAGVRDPNADMGKIFGPNLKPTAAPAAPSSIPTGPMTVAQMKAHMKEHGISSYMADTKEGMAAQIAKHHAKVELLDESRYQSPSPEGKARLAKAAEIEQTLLSKPKRSKGSKALAMLGPVAIAGAAAVAFDSTRSQAQAAGDSAAAANTKATGAAVVAGGTVAAVGWGIAKGVQLAAKGAAVVAPRAAALMVPGAGMVLGGLAAYGFGQAAVQGYKEGGVKGAAKGVADFATMGAVSHFGARLTPAGATQFEAADAAYRAMKPQAAETDSARKPGWGPEARIAAAKAQGAVNLPYGGNPENAPGYIPPQVIQPPKKER